MDGGGKEGITSLESISFELHLPARAPQTASFFKLISMFASEIQMIKKLGVRGVSFSHVYTRGRDRGKGKRKRRELKLTFPLPFLPPASPPRAQHRHSRFIRSIQPLMGSSSPSDLTTDALRFLWTRSHDVERPLPRNQLGISHRRRPLVRSPAPRLLSTP